jgi:hypothetical protein
MRKLALLGIAMLTLPACAQVFNMQQARLQMAPLDGLMHFHTGDDPRWSQPGFDDSSWPLISSDRSWSEQGYKNYSGFAWYRFKVVLPLGAAQLGLYVPRIMTSYQVFAEGRMVGTFGGFPPRAAIYELHPKLLLLPPSRAGELEIAIRVWQWPHWAIYNGGGLSGPPVIGNARQLQDWMTLQDQKTFWGLSALNILGLLNLVYGIAGIALFLMRRKERLYLWYGLGGLFMCAQFFAADFAAFHDLPQFTSGSGILMNGCSVAGFFCHLMFIWYLTGTRRTFWLWASAGAVALKVLMWTLPPLLDLPPWLIQFIVTTAGLVMSIGSVAMLIEAARRGDQDSRLLLVPTAFNALANFGGDMAFAIFAAGYPWIVRYCDFYYDTFTWPFPFSLYDVSVALLLIAIMGIVVLRFARSRNDEDQMKIEREAARAVQQVLVPAENPAIPGFQIDSVYKPAGEVGGDFFQILPTRAGGVLLLIGDVSGKGLPAAMTVSLLVGTFRTLAHYTQGPGEILDAMNQRMLGRGQGGFTTCLVLRIDSDGSLTAANAGHLAPYMDGEELSLESGLPLGLAAESRYPEIVFSLGAGTQLTILTDGVIEARSAQGELFGFERTAAIASQSAEAIAHAAQAFGQEDDITVLTIQVVAAEVLHA